MKKSKAEMKKVQGNTLSTIADLTAKFDDLLQFKIDINMRNLNKFSIPIVDVEPGGSV